MAARCKSNKERIERRKAAKKRSRIKCRAKHAAYMRKWNKLHPGYSTPYTQVSRARTNLT